jgi:hypothetical protein
MVGLDQSMLGATLDFKLTERRAASDRASSCVLFDINNIDISTSIVLN